MKLKVISSYVLPIAVSVYVLLQSFLYSIAVFNQHRDLSLTMMESFVLGNERLGGDERASDDGSDDGSDDEDNIHWWLGRDLDDDFEVPDGLRLRTPYDQRYNDITTWPFRYAKSVHIYFVHVGKAGGRSLYDRLSVLWMPMRARCRMRSQHINNAKCYGRNPARRRKMPVVAKRILGHIHVHNPKYKDHQRKWLRDNTNLLLVTVRDPIDRLRSAFNFHHNNFFEPKKKVREPGPSHMGVTIFIDCFREAEDLARAVVNATGTTKICRNIAFALLEGRAKKDPMPHFKFNYRYYLSQVRSERPKAVAVLRTEHQWEDLASVESHLGGNSTRFLIPERQTVFTHGSESFQLRSELSQKGAEALCCALHRDIQAYHDLVVAAVNLKGSEKLETLYSLLAHCGVDRTLSSPEIWEWGWKSWYEESESCREVKRLRSLAP